jgi:hypothetical protein
MIKRLYIDGAYRVCLVGAPGRKLTPVLYIMPNGIKFARVDNREADKAPAVLFKGAPYPLDRAKRRLRKAAKRGTQTKSVKEMLA